MLVGGPRDNQIVWVQESLPEFQVHWHVPFPLPSVIEEIILEPTVEVTTGWYFLDDFYWGNGQHEYFRFEDMGRKAAAKIYMRRMGASIHEIYNKVEWATWLE